jgi:hypothetical protein
MWPMSLKGMIGQLKLKTFYEHVCNFNPEKYRNKHVITEI